MNHPDDSSSRPKETSTAESRRPPAIVGGVWLYPHYLIDRLVHPRSRAEELLRLRRRFAHFQRLSLTSSEPELRLAADMRELRVRIAQATGSPRCCAACARSHPPPHGTWQGGYCCGTDTWRVFTDDELAALAAGGVRFHRLHPPRTDHAGCVFRGPAGCSISPANRPNICLRYLCLELVAELRGTGALKDLDRMGRNLKEQFERFVALRTERLERQTFESLERSLTPRDPPKRPSR